MVITPCSREELHDTLHKVCKIKLNKYVVDWKTYLGILPHDFKDISHYQYCLKYHYQSSHITEVVEILHDVTDVYFNDMKSNEIQN